MKHEQKLHVNFEVEAGKYEADGEKNYKVCFTTENFVDAVEMYNKCIGYPFNDLRVLVGVDDAWSTMTILGEQTDKEIEPWVRMGHMAMTLDQAHMILTDTDMVSIARSLEEDMKRGEEVIHGLECLKEQKAHYKRRFIEKTNEYDKLRKEHIEMRWKLDVLARRGSIGSDDIACILNEK